MSPMRLPWILIVAIPLIASCSNSRTTLRNPDTGQTAICAYSGWGWLGAPMAASAYADCKTKYQRLGFVKESDLHASSRSIAATPLPPPAAQPENSPSSAPLTNPVRPEVTPARTASTAVPGPPTAPPEPKREQPAWILGAWQAEEGKSGIVEGTGRFDFRRDGAELRWKMRRAGWLSGIRTTQEASGTVVRISETTAELTGKYHSSNVGGVGQIVRYSLTLDGDRLQGYELSEDGTQSAWSLRRVP